MNRLISILCFVMIYSLTYGQEYKAIKTIQRQTKEIITIATCDKYFATASNDKSLFVWDYFGKKIFKYSISDGEIDALCFMSDSNLLLVAVKEIDSKGFVRPILKCFDISGKLLREFIDTTLNQVQVDLYYQENTTGAQNAIVNASNSFPQLNIKTKINIPQVKSGLSHFEFIQNISISPNQMLIATIDYFKILKIWDKSGKLVKTIQIKNNKKDDFVYFTSDSTLYVTPDLILNMKTDSFISLGNYESYMGVPLNNTIYYYFDYNEPSESEKLLDIQTNTTKDFDLKNMYSLRASTSNDKFALLGVDGLIRIRNINGDLLSTFGKDRTEVITFRGKQIVLNSKIKTISFSQNGDYLISGDEEGKVIIWKTEK